MTHAEHVTNLMNATSDDDPLVLEAWLTDKLDQKHKVPAEVALRIALLQIEGTRNAVFYLAQQMDKLGLPL